MIEMTSPHKEIKRYRRFMGWDYSRGASLFITLVTEPRQPAFGLTAKFGCPVEKWAKMSVKERAAFRREAKAKAQ